MGNLDMVDVMGLHRFAPEEYHRDPAPAPSLSSTLARVLLNQSPLHAWTASPRLNPMWEPKDSATFDIGRAASGLGPITSNLSDVAGKGPRERDSNFTRSRKGQHR
jgi:hypothetical protein